LDGIFKGLFFYCYASRDRLLVEPPAPDALYVVVELKETAWVGRGVVTVLFFKQQGDWRHPSEADI
jgi:hypothetical protein